MVKGWNVNANKIHGRENLGSLRASSSSQSSYLPHLRVLSVQWYMVGLGDQLEVMQLAIGNQEVKEMMMVWCLGLTIGYLKPQCALGGASCIGCHVKRTLLV
jgi:hypothetical protein